MELSLHLFHTAREKGELFGLTGDLKRQVADELIGSGTNTCARHAGVCEIIARETTKRRAHSNVTTV